jgi:hypothetical protein
MNADPTPTTPPTNPYLRGGLDTNDVLRAKLDPDLYEGYCAGMIHKRMHEALGHHRSRPADRRRKYQSILYYVGQMMDNLDRRADADEPGRNPPARAPYPAGSMWTPANGS